VQSTLQSASSAATQSGENLTTENTNLTSANMADTLTQLDQVQTSYQAAMQSGVMIMNLSILNFIQ
jgi:flagellin-like hook-associated protein FlgL